MSDHVWNLSQERVYPIGIDGDWRSRMGKFLKDNSFKIVSHRPNRNVLKAEQRGIHVNFKPVVKVHVMMDEQGAAKVHIQYYARIKFVSAVAVGVLTGGLSTLVGAGTFANHVAEARDFFARLWFMIEQLTGESHQQTLQSSVAQTVVVDSPQPAPIIQKTTTTYGNYNPMFTAPVPTQTSSTMTYNASHLYSAPAPLPPHQHSVQMTYVPHSTSSSYPVVPQPPQSAMMGFDTMPPPDFGMYQSQHPNMMTGPPPPLPPRQYASSWQQQSTSSYHSGWQPH